MTSPTFCVLPWTHLCIRTDNTLKPCCRFLSDNPTNEFNTTLDDLNTYSTDAMNTTYFNDIRKKMLLGEKIFGCQKCYTQEKNKKDNKRSMREYFNDEISIEHKNLTEKFYNVKYIEMSIDNICNLQCKMCDSKFSSKLQNRDEFLGEVVYKKLEPNFSKLDNIDLKSLEYVKILGGEPFITPNFEKFLDFLFRKSKPENITLIIATNGTKIPNRNVIKKLNKFKSVHINVSIDAIDKINDYQRVGGSYVKTLENSKIYQNLIKNSFISYHVTISLLTANKLAETILYFESNELYYSTDFVIDPSHYSLKCAPDIFKNWILHENQVNNTSYNLLSNFFNGCDYHVDSWNKFISMVKTLDKYYKLKLEEYNFPLYNFLIENKFVEK
jgi:organic radical activating enzyme